MENPQLHKTIRDFFPFGFHVSRKAWEWLEISTLPGVSKADNAAGEIRLIRSLVNRINEKHVHSTHLNEPFRTGELYSMGIISDILRYMAGQYFYSQVRETIPKGLDWVKEHLGKTASERPVSYFVNLYPPIQVLTGEMSEETFLEMSTPVAENRERIIGEMILLSLAMENPAFGPFKDLFDDSDLKLLSPYKPFVSSFERFLADRPAFEPLGKPLFECLRTPMNVSPDSLHGQIEYIAEHWGGFLPGELMEKILTALDVISEEERLRGFGPGKARVLRFDGDMYYPEPESFSRDADWMSNVVLIAKSAYVWLDQLSKKYGRDIRYLSDIPDEELDQLAGWGFSGLWLIGIWERSNASRKIKQIMGNPEAAPSAYSLYDYVIAGDLGGEAAYGDLSRRAWERGIRLASDMVPNHMGIYSKWVIEHPDWFLQTGYPPFPAYNFTGTDLSDDPRVMIQIEDGYWEHRDAAVVFKRMDKYTGDVKYIYHGNDGTSMPWNDTAQLNYLLPEVREAVIQTILHVARKFPIIRFDAAMTLAKKHYQRLWFPQHGEGGAIPSRAEYGMSRPEFDKVFPKEFWREVVNRVAEEVPETLLLAEAFWLMEGYFVRTLGMHRVYNSAFMNMLKMEENYNYRSTVKNVLEYSPEILKRFVNFMNNPDEATAVTQFGREDKYYGVAVLMVTMPGLPMFGHGQIEGLEEKYGMEYYRAYWDEQADAEMVSRHEREIFPLMRRRRLFSGVEHFAFYDFHTADHGVDENVFAYSNRANDERAVIIYNNAYTTTSGWINVSTLLNKGSSEEPRMVRRTLAEALGLDTSGDCYYAFRDSLTGLQYLHQAVRIAREGLFAKLQGYQYHAFTDFRELRDTDDTWAKLSERLNGRGVPNLEYAYLEMIFEPVLTPFRDLLSAERLSGLFSGKKAAMNHYKQAQKKLLAAVEEFTGNGDEIAASRAEIVEEARIITELPGLLEKQYPDTNLAARIRMVIENSEEQLRHVAVAWSLVRQLGMLLSSKGGDEQDNREKLDLSGRFLVTILTEEFRDFVGGDSRAYHDALLTAVLSDHDGILEKLSDEEAGTAHISESLKNMFDESIVAEYLHINTYQGNVFLGKEQLERLMDALLLVTTVRVMSDSRGSIEELTEVQKTTEAILNAAHKADYKVEKMLNILKG